ncbi:hypothetical protein [Nitrosopumilus ureiphilus]|uniref:Transcriptional regulator n=1 Tax=Nitrosopumilus ureiphilus TaxID=1470067 RepID=A0A7D5M4R1_9ARCH|nr:hypothetical protein [Nitrosopumilus ureiphilus]QLH07194.1 hypothetical protein C5F50_08960 [Nitrosopumilus ureiphilus]
MLQYNPHAEEESILKLISDQCSRKIIDSIQTEPKNAVQISNELDAELSAIYRRLHKFQKYNLLKITVQITTDGKKSYYYQCKINGVDLRYQNGNFKVILSFNQI